MRRYVHACYVHARYVHARYVHARYIHRNSSLFGWTTDQLINTTAGAKDTK